MPGKKYIGRVLGLDTTYIVVAIILVIWLVFTKHLHFRKIYILKTLKFTIPVIPHLLSQMVLTPVSYTHLEDLYVENIHEMVLFNKKTVKKNVMEFDSFEELRKLIPEYYNSSGCKIIEKIARELGCCEKDLKNFEAIKLSLIHICLQHIISFI